ncbi:general secretion pathway protein GspB [Alkalilimnicola sp. S0819]|uniref:general secretion pathway protein GspB n=1 Tax=Alkalilimnicola sp. S0819 TaxID=2613922 RepID=UPI0012620537|nr:general secretion pathway protein GspB [Alkalilimnicola sp. S0819]KAB7623713.1 hypothetical protein F3N43_09355 [Alkalilimnicola sp. S0819]MPQ16842.1 hypothetical protein [Alkalilimnicola sp. S0819]
MSFILDALKRSEAERHRQQPPAVTGPVLADPPTPRPRNWAPWLALVLLINAVLLGALFWPRGPDETSSAPDPEPTLRSAPQATPPTPAGAAAEALPPSRPGALADEAGYGRPATRSAAPIAPPTMAEPGGEPVPAARAPSAASQARPARPKPPPSRTETTAPKQAQPQRHALPAQASAEAPLLSELPQRVRAGIPPIPVNIHVYAPEPASRFVLIDMRRYTEGDTLHNGPRLEAITADGLVLEHQGRRFRIQVR